MLGGYGRLAVAATTAVVAWDMAGPHGIYSPQNPNYTGELKNRYSRLDGETVQQADTRKALGLAADIGNKKHIDPNAVLMANGFSTNNGLRAEEIGVENLVRADEGLPSSNPAPKVQQIATLTPSNVPKPTFGPDGMV